MKIINIQLQRTVSKQHKAIVIILVDGEQRKGEGEGSSPEAAIRKAIFSITDALALELDQQVTVSAVARF